MKGWKKISKANAQGKKAEVAILVSDKIDFKTKAIKRDTELHFIILKGRIHQEDININIYAPNIGAPTDIRKILEDFKKETDRNTVIVEDFNTPLSTMDRSSKHRIDKNIVSLNDTLDQVDLIDTYRIFYPKGEKYNSFKKHMDHFQG